MTVPLMLQIVVASIVVIGALSLPLAGPSSRELGPALTATCGPLISMPLGDIVILFGPHSKETPVGVETDT